MRWTVLTGMQDHQLVADATVFGERFCRTREPVDRRFVQRLEDDHDFVRFWRPESPAERLVLRVPEDDSSAIVDHRRLHRKAQSFCQCRRITNPFGVLTPAHAGGRRHIRLMCAHQRPNPSDSEAP